MSSVKKMAKAANVTKAPVTAKSTERVEDLSSSEAESATSSSGSDSTSSSGSDSEEELPTQISKPKASQATSTPAKINKAAPPPPFVPPIGFEELKPTSASKVAKLLSTDKLAGKQIWYITAPASVPITSIKEVSLRDIEKGKPAITLNGTDYGFVKDAGAEKDAAKLLAPNKDGKKYETSQRRIDQVLHLQQIVSLEGMMTKEKATVPAPKKFVRQQPRGLRMRFKPIGFGDEEPGTIGESEGEQSDVEMADAPRVFKKHKVTEEEGAEGSPKKKSKKDKSEKKEKKDKKEKKAKKEKA